jgi:hypothetical protein
LVGSSPGFDLFPAVADILDNEDKHEPAFT